MARFYILELSHIFPALFDAGAWGVGLPSYLVLSYQPERNENVSIKVVFYPSGRIFYPNGRITFKGVDDKDLPVYDEDTVKR